MRWTEDSVEDLTGTVHSALLELQMATSHLLDCQHSEAREKLAEAQLLIRRFNARHPD